MTPLVSLFVERSGFAGRSPLDAIEDRVELLHREVGGTGRGSLTRYFEARNVRETELVPGLKSDGLIRPLGASFEDGFVVGLKRELPEVRRRFTEAHELCHTFFYELVPEVKFQPHDADALEERLCNHGAAALLVPRDGLAKRLEGRRPSLTALDELAQRYGVSFEAMFMRLRHLGLWDCHLSIWHRTTAGRYMALQTYGWKRAEWNWMHEEALDAAWKGGAIVTGSTFVYREDEDGRSFARPIQYEARRHGSVIKALSSRRALGELRSVASLF